MRPYGFVGSSRLRLAEALLPKAVAQWMQQWCFVAPGHITVLDMDTVLHDGIQPDQLWQEVDAGRGKLWIASRMAPVWRHTVFADFCGDMPVDRVSDQMLDTARADLINSLLAAMSLAAVSVAASGAPEVLGNFAGHLGSTRLLLRLVRAQAVLDIVFDASLLEHYLLPAKCVRPLLTRRQALGSTHLAVQVCLPFAQLPLRYIEALRPGDILVGNAQLSQPFQLRCGQSLALAQGFLVQEQGRRAWQIDAGAD